MARPKNPVELNFEDLAGPGAAATNPEVIKPGGAEVPGGTESGGDLMTQIDGFFERVNTTITNVKELLSMWKGINPNPGPGQGAGAAQQPYAPQPTLMQQLHRLLNMAYTAYGDITVTQLMQGLLEQYGNTKLSAALKWLEKMQ